MTTSGYTCVCCDTFHEGWPAVGFDAPSGWDAAMSGRARFLLTSDLCIMDGQDFFVRAVLRIPVVDAEQDFEWGVWVSQSKKNFRRLRLP